MVSAHNKTFFFFSRALNKKKERNTCDALWWKLYEFSNESYDTRCVILSSAELQMVENARVRNQSGRFHKTKTKKTAERCSVPAQQMKLHVFFLSDVFLSPRSLFLFQIRDSSQTQRFREIIELFSSSVKIALWVSFSGLVWFHPRTLLSLLVDFSPEAPCSRRHLQATYPTFTF